MGTETKERVWGLAQGPYAGLDHCHLTELLEEREGLVVSRSTLRRIFTPQILWPDLIQSLYTNHGRSPFTATLHSLLTAEDTPLSFLHTISYTTTHTIGLTVGGVPGKLEQ